LSIVVEILIDCRNWEIGTKVETVKRFQCSGALLLRVGFTNEEGVPDAIIWKVKDLSRWVDLLAKFRQ